MRKGAIMNDNQKKKQTIEKDLHGLHILELSATNFKIMALTMFKDIERKIVARI